MTAFNNTEIQQFYKPLNDLMEKTNVCRKTSTVMKTSISTIQDPGKVLAATGRIGSITSWERGKKITLLCTISAAGEYIHYPNVYFSQKDYDPDPREGCPNSSYI